MMNHKRPSHAEMKKTDEEWEKERAEVLKSYQNVRGSEIFALDQSVLLFLKYRLPYTRKHWERDHNIDKETCPDQYQEFCELCELIELTDYILEEKWDEEIVDPEPYDWTGKTFKDYMKDNFIKQPDGSALMKPSSAAHDEYLKKLWKLEAGKRERWLELFGKLFWRL